MSKRLQCSEARRCSQRQIGSETGGLGGAFLNEKGKLVSWFGLKLESDIRKLLGSWNKDTLIYELELCAAVLFINLWCRGGYNNLHVSFGDNEGVRCALIKASRTGAAAASHRWSKSKFFGVVCTCAYGSKHKWLSFEACSTSLSSWLAQFQYSSWTEVSWLASWFKFGDVRFHFWGGRSHIHQFKKSACTSVVPTELDQIVIWSW